VHVLLAALVALPAGLAAAERLLVVMSGESASYQQALAGIQQAGADTEAFLASAENEAAIGAALQNLGRDGAIVTLGAKATAFMARAVATTPTVSCMANGDDGKAPTGALLVPLDVPMEAQLLWLNRLLPNARNVGILFDPAQNERRAAEVAAALTRAGYVPVLEPVTGSSALPNALNRLTNSIDVLHAIPDTTVFAREHSRALLLFSFRNRIPLTGPSEAWVRAGALYAIDWDYQDLGRYCAALALRQLGGNKAAPPPPPRTRVVVNARTADQMRIKWDAETLDMVERSE
jgi:putative ABC transport system substrate-binding protein